MFCTSVIGILKVSEVLHSVIFSILEPVILHFCWRCKNSYGVETRPRSLHRRDGNSNSRTWKKIYKKQPGFVICVF